MPTTREFNLTVGDMISILKEYPNDFKIDIHEYNPVIFIRDTDGNIVRSIDLDDD